MNLSAKLRDEIRSVGLATLFFGAWFFVLLVLKWLVLAEYRIEFHGLSMALIGALIVAKVVLLLENVPLGAWIRDRPAVVDVAARTGLYGLGVLVVLLLEKAFEARHEYGGFASSLVQVIHHQDIPHVLAAAIGVTGALLVFNASFVVRRRLGKRGLLGLLLSPLPEQQGKSIEANGSQ
ncbi:MAG: hypothetical protein WAN46_11990 [Gammaproteobacteria bacterium]|jgi:hypothetical protein